MTTIEVGTGLPNVLQHGDSFLIKDTIPSRELYNGDVQFHYLPAGNEASAAPVVAEIQKTIAKKK